jgi:hypothetical protein
MFHLTDLVQILAVIVIVIIMAMVLRARHRGKAAHDLQYAHDNVCEHLKPALQHLEAHGHQIKVVGQQHPELPLEIYLHPPFDPSTIYKELKLEPPVYVSERNVLYCKEDWCELHPMK